MDLTLPSFGRKRNIIGVALLLGFIILTWMMVPSYYQSESDETFSQENQQIYVPEIDYALTTNTEKGSITEDIELIAPALATTTEKGSVKHTDVIDLDAPDLDSVSILKKCYMHKEMIVLDPGNPIELFEDVLISDRNPRIDKTIFFVETRCSADNLVQLTSRQACAIESVARVNPNWDIFVLFASPVGFSKNSSLHSPAVHALRTYSNIFLRNVYLWTYAYGTPFHDWINKGELYESKHFVAHTSDYLRFLTLYKFGGIFMDLDVVVQKSFENVKLNFAGAELNGQVGATIMGFTQTGIGHGIASLCARDFVSNFNGTLWDHNGGRVITRVLQFMCKTESAFEMTRERCRNFKVYPPNTFYAVSWPDWPWLFDSDFTNITLALTENSLAIHAWNEFSSEAKVDSNCAYGVIAREKCPNAYASNGNNF